MLKIVRNFTFLLQLLGDFVLGLPRLCPCTTLHGGLPSPTPWIGPLWKIPHLRCELPPL